MGGGIVPRLIDIAKEVGNAVGTRERVAPLFRRLKELETYMDPSFGESKGKLLSTPFLQLGGSASNYILKGYKK